jgi:flagellin
MSSLLTNASAMTALQTLTQINKDLATTQGRISTGQRVSKASDNAAYWSIATTMRSDNSALSAVQDALGLGAAKVDTAYAGMDAAIEVVKKIKDKLATAQEASADKTKIQSEITQLRDQLRGIAESATFSGENWLQADINAAPVTKSVVSSFVRDSGGGVSVKKLDYVLDQTTVLYDTGTTGGNEGILDRVYVVPQSAAVTLTVNINGSSAEYQVAAYTADQLVGAGATFTGTTQGHANVSTGALVGDYVKIGNDWVKAIDVGTSGQEVVYDDGTTDWGVNTGATVPNVPAPSSIDNMNIVGMSNANLAILMSAVDKALTDMTTAASALGSISSRIDLQIDFVSKLTDSLDRGIGRLVDADMEEESARLSALQVQQQLGIQALSIANANSQNILSLFRS